MKESDIRNQDTLNRYLDLVALDCSRYFSDRSRFRIIPCPACSSTNFSKQFQKNDFTYVTCDICDTLYARERPPDQKLLEFYTDSESASFWVNHFFQPFIEQRREKIFVPRVTLLSSVLGEQSGWRIGDIGAGFGIFLEELSNQWPENEYIAIEPSVELCRICREKGLEVINSLLEQVNETSQFDLLTAFELFEHLNNPERFIQKVHEILRPGGILFMSTLNGQGFDIRVLWENAKSVSPPHHLNFFNPASISQFLVNNGFIVRYLETPGKLDWDIVEGMIAYGEHKVDPFWEVLSRVGTAEAKRELQGWIVKNRLSSHMCVLAQRA